MIAYICKLNFALSGFFTVPFESSALFTSALPTIHRLFTSAAAEGRPLISPPLGAIFAASGNADADFALIRKSPVAHDPASDAIFLH
jgi:hypothetical protein